MPEPLDAAEGRFGENKSKCDRRGPDKSKIVDIEECDDNSTNDAC
jgi:hypothetical protein